MFWGLRLLVKSPGLPGYAVFVGASPATSGDVARLLGTTAKDTVAEVAAAPALQASTRLKLTGVMSPKASSKSGQGIALISVDGKPARAFGVGARIDGELRLLSVSLRAASISDGQGQPSFVLELPPLAAPNTGSFSPLGSEPGSTVGSNARANAGPGAGMGSGSASTQMPATLSTVPRGIPYSPASPTSKPAPSDGSPPAPGAPAATMQTNPQSAQ